MTDIDPLAEDRLAQDHLGGQGDDIYAALLAAHEGLAFEASAALNARLVLLLANAVGDVPLVLAAIERARTAAPDQG
ncbi:DUF2783 domain-containing protein [Nitrospirillum amazonense]|uniref:Uncharacterized protein DUF2783 n=1 Tax=Nitrospirillum amazonense TaxID=28077 RepID=A0A560K395_9PROT|nr:DUF2783 domain-containing protein [Nitrospirillum amazonense]MDG3444259.1 DUF2783 domain-containing protein [Nitrospirillum amazonense]TWB77813.1 uncharacterized protein DUF2783 [Nitrospirillum amazonense]